MAYSDAKFDGCQVHRADAFAVAEKWTRDGRYDASEPRYTAMLDPAMNNDNLWSGFAARIPPTYVRQD
jgi:hypothetical protein